MAPHASQQPRQNAPDPPRRACIPLAHKRVPTEMRAPADHAHLLYAAIVGEYDISKVRAHLLTLPVTHWHEAYNREHNVYFQRPFHDKLGVDNIMCVFSDTQLENVFVLPRYEEFREYLEQIFEVMGVHPEQVVRCLFARMPGDTLIPAHHDNGPWVSKTHRIHVPIVTFPEVAFCSGALEASMTRYAFNEGTIVELNNAAKHSVHNPTAHYRIHLIFDYVDTTHVIQNRSTLPAGQMCRQVRGRVELVDKVDVRAEEQAKKQAGRMLIEIENIVKDRTNADAAAVLTTACRHYFIEQINAKAFVKTIESKVLVGDKVGTDFRDLVWKKLMEMFTLVDVRMGDELAQARIKKVFAPNWVIIGAQKCGTTSLYDYLSQHPLAMKGQRREPHFFDWAWDAALKHTLSVEDRAKYEPVLQLFSPGSAGADLPVDVPLDSNSLDDLRIKYLLSLQCERGAELRPPFQIGESTPSYLLYGEPVAKRLKLLYPDMKLIVALRDPTKRAFSHYQMTADPNGTAAQLRMRRAVKGKSFEQIVDDDLKLLEETQVAPDSLVSGENEANAALDRFQEYANALAQQHGAHSYVGRGLYALQLGLWLRVFPRDQVLVIDLDDMKTAEGTQQEVNRAFEFLELPPHQVADTERKNTRKYESMDPAMEQRLREFYAPYNEQLFELLGRRFKW